MCGSRRRCVESGAADSVPDGSGRTMVATAAVDDGDEEAEEVNVTSFLTMLFSLEEIVDEEDDGDGSTKTAGGDEADWGG